ASGGAFARRRDHVEAVGVGRISDDLAVDLGPAGPGPLVFLEHHDTGPAGDHEAVAVGVVGPAGDARPVVEVGAHRAHGVEQHRQGPVQLFRAAGEHHVLLAPGDLLVADPDAVGGGS